MQWQDGVPLLFDKKNTVLFAAVSQKAVKLQVQLLLLLLLLLMMMMMMMMMTHNDDDDA
jgi:hypothetical protein